MFKKDYTVKDNTFFDRVNLDEIHFLSFAFGCGLTLAGVLSSYVELFLFGLVSFVFFGWWFAVNLDERNSDLDEMIISDAKYRKVLKWLNKYPDLRHVITRYSAYNSIIGADVITEYGYCLIRKNKDLIKRNKHDIPAAENAKDGMKEINRELTRLEQAASEK